MEVNQSIKITIPGEPMPKQSARFRIAKSKGKQFIQSYQKAEITRKEIDIAYIVKQQLPKDFKILDSAIGVNALFVFSPLKKFSKKTLELIKGGGTVYKDTKPDLIDNLPKLPFDAMQGIVYTNDSRICVNNSIKIYGMIPRIELEFFLLKNG